MNASILKIYRTIPLHQQQALRKRFEDSPKFLLLLEFLEEWKGDKFSAPQAIRWVYKEELEAGLEEGVAINRFYKLRKKIEEALHLAQGESTENTSFHPAFKELNNAIKLMGLNQPQEAFKKLKALYPVALKDNLFEILPEICENLIYSNQLSLSYKPLDDWFEKWDAANQLMKDLNRAKFYSRFVFSESTKKGYAAVLPYLEILRQISARYKKYPRFAAIYHYSCITIAARSVGKSPQSLGKHFKALETILSAYPKIPWQMANEAYELDNEFSLKVNRASFSIAKSQFRQALAELSDAIALVKREPLLQRRVSAALLMNKLRMEVFCELYTEALKTCKMLLESDKKQSNIVSVYGEMARVYIYGYPDVIPENRPELYEMIDMLIAEYQKAGLDSDFAEMTGIKAILLYQEGKYKEALKYYTRDYVQAYFIRNGFEITMTDKFFYRPEITFREEMISELEKKLHAFSDPSIFTFCKMLKRTLEHEKHSPKK